MMRFTTLFFFSLLSLRVAMATAYEATSRPTGYLAGAAAGPGRAGGPAHLYAPAALAALGQSPTPGLSVYPNPARGQTNVQVSGPGGADYKLRLSNVLGGEVRRLPVRPDNNPTDGFALDLSDLPPGLYFCSLLVNDKTLVTKRLTVL